MKRRRRLKGQLMRLLRVKVSEAAYQELQNWAPDWHNGAVLDEMILRTGQRRRRKAMREQEAQNKVTP